jgi:CBS domain-containing protein
MLVRYFMTPNVITFSPEQKCHEALLNFRKHRIRRAPVLDRNQLVGIVSERDLYHILPGTPWQASEETGAASLDMPVKSIMRTRVFTVRLNDHIETAARLMLTHKVGGIPVMKDGHLKGIITESDVFKAMWSILPYRTSCRILFTDRHKDIKKISNEYLNICFRHHCLVHTFLSYPESDDGFMYYLCIQGEGVDNVINDLWSHSCEVIFVEKEDVGKRGARS